MATTTHPATALSAPSEAHVVQTVFMTLKVLFVVVPIVAGLDKFTNLLAHWETYLNPLALSIVPVTAATFMHIVGVIEIVAGIIVAVKPRIGGFIVMAWLLAIALQLIVMGRFLDVAVRDIVMALAGALTLARLSPFTASAAPASSR